MLIVDVTGVVETCGDTMGDGPETFPLIGCDCCWVIGIGNKLESYNVLKAVNYLNTFDLILNKKPRLPINSFTLHRFQNQNIMNNDKYDLTLHGWYKIITAMFCWVTEKLLVN